MCHCLQCQRRTGSTYSVHAYFRRDTVTTAGRTTSYRRTGDTGCYITFRFCPVCGSTVHWDVEAMPDMLGVPIGVFADPDFPQPTMAIFVGEKHPWVVVPDGVPQKEGHSDRFQASARAALAARTDSTR